jgi:hypothetical protein
VGGFLLQRNVLYKFSPWAQFRQPEEQKLRYCRNGKRKTFAKNCASGANPKCPWNYPASDSQWSLGCQLARSQKRMNQGFWHEA